jgi:hypothetical protein
MRCSRASADGLYSRYFEKDPAHVVLLRHPAFEELRRSVVVTPGETIKPIVDLVG